ncbi:MAG TPA: FUSC family protein [Candidatus Margulisiibacteriota bacterium]|nr:FUSC family protein [Candidatus Margulisiibacteriota bacterium]
MSAAPAIDEGDPPGLALLWQRLVSPTPGRLENTVRVVVLVLATVVIGETFRLPEIAVSAYIVLFVSGAEAASSVMTALIGGAAVILAVFATIVALMLSLSEPALRVPMIACMTFIGMFLARTTGQLGIPFFIAGFIIGYGMTLGNEVLGFALMPGSVANTPQTTLPELAFIPPEEALLHFLLWLALAVAIPVTLVVIANLLTGRDPAVMVRAALVKRLQTAARFCEGQPGADRQLASLTGEGTAALLKLRHLSGLLHKSAHPAPVVEIQRLLLLLMAVNRVSGRDRLQDSLVPVAQFCRDAAETLQNSATSWPETPEITLTGAAQPVGHQITRALRDIREPPAPAHPVTKEPSRLLAPDAFSNPDHVRFALKVTLAVMLCYFAQNMLDWPGIHTCMITCFFVALTTVGETVHKGTLRLTGCIVGGVLGIGTILLLMPVMTDLGELLLLVAAVTFLAGWVGYGGERISYAGWQVAMAFYLSTFQDFGPTLDMATARDRIVGLVLGDLVILVIFTAIWPVSAARVARANLAKAVEQLSALFQTDEAEAVHRAAFVQSMEQARAVMVNEAFEPRAVLTSDGRRPIDGGILSQVQFLIVPVSVILDLRRETPGSITVATYHSALADWFQRAAAWIRDGDGAASVAESLPGPPAAESAGPLGAWHRVLYQDLCAILREVGPR